MIDFSLIDSLNFATGFQEFSEYGKKAESHSTSIYNLEFLTPSFFSAHHMMITSWGGGGNVTVCRNTLIDFGIGSDNAEQLGMVPARSG